MFDVRRLWWRSALVCALMAPAIAPPLAAQQSAGRVFNPRINPVFPGADLVAYEQLEVDRRELQFQRLSTGTRFPARRAPVVGEFSLPGLVGDTRMSVYSGDLDWRPAVTASRYWFAYVAGDSRGLHIYLNYIDARGALAPGEPLEVPFAGGARSPRWSADGRHVAFVSDSGVVHVIWNADRAVASGSAAQLRPTRIDVAGRPALFPAWSPRGASAADPVYLAYQVERTIRGNRVFAIDVLTINPSAGAVLGPPVTVTEALQGASAYRPSWSPDGTMIAYYTDRGRAVAGESQQLDVRVVEVQKSRDGSVFRGELLQGRSPRLAENVLPVESRGPEWTRIAVGAQTQPAIVYVQRDEAQNNPIAVVAIQPWRSMRTRAESEVVYSTRWGTANHKEVNGVEGCRLVRFAYVSVAGGGESVRSQDVQAPWAQGPCGTVPPDTRTNPVVAAATGGNPSAAPRRPSIALSALFPGAGQLAAGRAGKGTILALGGVAGAAVAFLGASGTKSAADDAAVAIENRRQDEWASLESDYNSKKSMVTIGAGVAAAAWLVSVVDAAMSRGGSESARLTVGVVPAPSGHADADARAIPQARVGWRIPFGGASR